MDFETDRRRFLQLAGAGAAASFAGCSALQGEEVQPEATTQEGVGDSATVTVAIEIDQEALQQLQADLQSKLQNGTINQTEAQREFQQAQTELVTQAVDSFREWTEDEDSIAIDEAAEQLGILLVSGTPVTLIESLTEAEVRGLLPADVFEEAQSQSGGF